MKNLLALFLLSFVVLTNQTAFAQYCSKYKSASLENRLIIDDHRSDSVDILHTLVDLTIRPNIDQSINGSSTLSLLAKEQNILSVRFDFEGLTVDSVVGSIVQSFDHQDSILVVNFNAALSTTSSIDVTVYYHGNPIKDVTGWGGFYFQSGYAWNLGVGFGADPHSYGRVWFPCFDNFIERSTFEFLITTDSNKIAACNGVLQSENSNGNGTKTYAWKLDQSIPSYLACVAIGNYQKLTSQVNGLLNVIPIELFASAGDTNNLKASFIHLSDAVEAFENSYGPYRFDKVGYSLVPFNAGAMEHATNITYPIYAANGSLSNESLMAHELGHMWWGDNVTCQTDGDMWINEGWASFSVYLFNEAVYGRESYEQTMMDELRYMLQFGHHFEESYRAVSGQPHNYVYGDHVYKKGALVAHNLRGYMGDELFFSTIKSFMETYKYTPVSSDTMERYFTEISGIDLESFFRDWIFSGGYNVVVVDSFNSIANAAGYDLKLYFQQKLKGREDLHDDVPVYFRVYDAAMNSVDGEGSISGKYATLDFQSSINPAFILIYPQNEQAQARTRDMRMLSQTGNHDLKNMYWDVNVTSIEDSAFVVFDHIWSVPDPIKQWSDKAFHMSDYHYWKVHGIDLSKAEMTAEFRYDGRTTPSNAGYLDMDLLSETEDSLLLLYRADASKDWAEYEFYSLNNLGNTTDQFGVVTLSKVLEGEYVFANYDQSALGEHNVESTSVIKVFPNPARQTVNVTLIGYDSCELTILDLTGKLVLSQRVNRGDNQISITNLSQGSYLVKIMSQGNLVATEKLVIKD